MSVAESSVCWVEVRFLLRQIWCLQILFLCWMCCFVWVSLFVFLWWTLKMRFLLGVCWFYCMCLAHMNIYA